MRLAQTGKLSCARQCEEPLPELARRVVLEEKTVELARRLREEMPIDTGFALVLFNYGVAGSMAFASTGRREDTMAMLRELLDKLGTEGG